MISARVRSSAVAIEERRIEEQAERIAAQRAARIEAEQSGARPTAEQRLAMQPKVPWVDDVRDCIRRHGQRVFTLYDLARFHTEMQKRHQGCAEIEPSIRAALQKLRERGEVVFVDDAGTYIFTAFERTLNA